MKKLYLTTILLFVFTTLFTGCNNNPGNGSGSGAATDPLFSTSEVTQDLTIEFGETYLSDGNWIYKQIGTDDLSTSIIIYEFSYSSDTQECKLSRWYDYEKETYPEGVPSEYRSEYLLTLKESNEEYGYTCTISGAYLISQKEHSSSEFDSIETFLESSMGFNYADDVKTNAAKTKFYYTETDTRFRKNYLMKK